MTRLFYRCLVALHPPMFRREFGPEMLWIFDEAATDFGVAGLFGDALASLTRQWVVRAGAWKLAAAAVGGLLMLLPGLMLTHSIHPARRVVPEESPNAFFFVASAATLIIVSSTALLAVVWFRMSTKRR